MYADWLLVSFTSRSHVCETLIEKTTREFRPVEGFFESFEGKILLVASRHGGLVFVPVFVQDRHDISVVKPRTI